MSQEPVPPPVPDDSLWVEVSDQKAVLRSISGRDKAGKPIMTIREPRVRLEKGSRLFVSATHQESHKDPGDGIIFATGNISYYFVLDAAINGDAAGLFVQVGDVTVVPFEAAGLPAASDTAQPQVPVSDATRLDIPAPLDTQPPASEPEAGLLVEVSGKKALAHTFHARDKAGKPIMTIREPRVRLERGARLTVSATRLESDKDKGDGVIHATGNVEFYFVLDQPSNGETAGLYIKAEDVKLV